MSGDLTGPSIAGYRVTAKLGEGGMGEVYRATDTRLKRDVAIKVLPAAFTEDTERLARFEREAQLLAQLQHPNIASIYGLEEADGVRALVMELVEGPTLAERLDAGSLSRDESLSIARQIAEALEAAHEKGIVHRDLKPQNIKASIEGKVKVLDFGLAKAMDPVGAAAGVGSASQLAASPTMTLGATVQGMILGTAAYMAPEQARGAAVDKRADIWAFGVVLYEMLSGRRAFLAETVPDTLAAVLTRELDMQWLPASTPLELRRLLRRCLARNPKERLHDIADARLVLAEIERGDSEPSHGGDRSQVARRGRAGWRWPAVALLAALAGVGVGRLARPPAVGAPVYRRLTNETGYIHSARFTPDGESVVFGEARVGGPVELFSTLAAAAGARRFDLPSADVVGVSGNSQMALILDRRHSGSWLRRGTLAQASLSGGAVRSLVDAVYDADIARDGASFAVVRQVGPEQRLEFPIGQMLHRTTGWISSPRIAPDGQRVAFADHPVLGDDQGFVAVVDRGGKARRLSGLANFLHGVVWSPAGDEIYASHGNIDSGSFFKAYALDGTVRDLLSSPTFMRIQDVARDGRVLLTSDAYEVASEGRLESSGADVVHFASWVGESFAGIADDGRLFAGSSGSLGDDGEYRAFFRPSEASSGTPPVFVGSGTALGLTPDGRWIFVATAGRERSILRAEPTGAGETRRFDLGAVEPGVSGTGDVTASKDGSRIAFPGKEGDSLPRGYVLDLVAGQAPRAVTPEGVASLFLSPLGDLLVAVDAAGAMWLYDVAGAPARPVPGVGAGEVPLAWASAGDAVFVWDKTLPARVFRVDLAIGARQLAFEWTPRDPNGMLYALLNVSTDAKYFLVRFRRGRSSLVVTELPER